MCSILPCYSKKKNCLYTEQHRKFYSCKISSDTDTDTDVSLFWQQLYNKSNITSYISTMVHSR